MPVILNRVNVLSELIGASSSAAGFAKDRIHRSRRLHADHYRPASPLPVADENRAVDSFRPSTPPAGSPLLIHFVDQHLHGLTHLRRQNPGTHFALHGHELLMALSLHLLRHLPIERPARSTLYVFIFEAADTREPRLAQPIEQKWRSPSCKLSPGNQR